MGTPLANIPVDSSSVQVRMVPYGSSSLGVVWPFFGPAPYRTLRDECRRRRVNMVDGSKVSASIPSSSQSLAALGSFGDIHRSGEIPRVLDHERFFLSRVVYSKDALYVNPPRDSGGSTVTSESKLSSLLGASVERDGVRLLDNDNALGIKDFGSIRYDVSHGLFSSCDFTNHPLARVMSHSYGESLVALTRLLPSKVLVSDIRASNQEKMGVLSLRFGDYVSVVASSDGLTRYILAGIAKP